MPFGTTFAKKDKDPSLIRANATNPLGCRRTQRRRYSNVAMPLEREIRESYSKQQMDPVTLKFNQYDKYAYGLFYHNQGIHRHIGLLNTTMSFSTNSQLKHHDTESKFYLINKKEKKGIKVNSNSQTSEGLQFRGRKKEERTPDR